MTSVVKNKGDDVLYATDTDMVNALYGKVNGSLIKEGMSAHSVLSTLPEVLIVVYENWGLLSHDSASRIIMIVLSLLVKNYIKDGAEQKFLLDFLENELPAFIEKLAGFANSPSLKGVEEKVVDVVKSDFSGCFGFCKKKKSEEKR
jgi:hypothetical protein